LNPDRYDYGVILGSLILFTLIPQLLGKRAMKTFLDWLIFGGYVLALVTVTVLWYFQFSSEDKSILNWIYGIATPALFVVVFRGANRKRKIQESSEGKY
jgi:CDP-diglyceride synthetase